MLQVRHRTHSSPKQALGGKFPADRRQKHAEMQRFPKRYRANCSTSACYLRYSVPHPTPLHDVFPLSPGRIFVFIRSLSFVKAAAMRSQTGITTPSVKDPAGISHEYNPLWTSWFKRGRAAATPALSCAWRRIIPERDRATVCPEPPGLPRGHLPAAAPQPALPAREPESGGERKVSAEGK